MSKQNLRDLCDKVGGKEKPPFKPIPNDIIAPAEINPRLPVQNREGAHVVLISIDPTKMWGIKARVDEVGSFTHTFTSRGGFNGNIAASPLDLFNVSRETYREAFPNDTRFK